MDINGYELGALVHMGVSGPMWRTKAPDGRPALLALRAPEEGRRLERRWKAWAGLEHPGIATLIDVARHEDGRWAVIVEDVRGTPLDLLIGSPGLRDLASRRRVLSTLREGVDALHGAGIVHGDICPANVIVRPDGRSVLIDLVDELTESEGTPGWSLEMAKDIEGDLRALETLAKALGFSSLEAALVEGPPQESASGLERSPDADAVEALRIRAARSATVRAPAPSRAPRFIGLAALVIIAVGVTAVWTMASTSVAADPGVATTGSEVPVAPCPDQETMRASLEALLSERDDAYLDLDLAALPSGIGGDLRAQDEAHIRDMVERGASISAMRTELVFVGAPRCNGATGRAQVVLEQNTLTVCSAGTCDSAGAGIRREIDLVFDPVPFVVLEARAPSEGTQSG